MLIKNLIYLDIDGVMCLSNSRLGKGNYFIFNDESLSVLKSLLLVKDTYIIVSSSWKYYKSIEHLNDVVFSQYGLCEFVLSKTIDLCFDNDDYCREDEIYDTIKQYSDCNHLILDDLLLNFSSYDFNFLKGNFLNYNVDGSVGLCFNDFNVLNNFLLN